MKLKVNVEDAMLIERTQTGDRSAFNQLVEKHHARAYQFAHRLTKDTEEASDIVAETFLRVYKALPRFKGESAFSTWMFRIATNCYLDARKRRNTRTLSSDDTLITPEGEVTHDVEDPSPSAFYSLCENETLETFSKAVHGLVPKQRAIILLYHNEMLSYEQIAERLELPIGTVKSRLNRARSSLRQVPELVSIARAFGAEGFATA